MVRMGSIQGQARGLYEKVIKKKRHDWCGPTPRIGATNDVVVRPWGGSHAQSTGEFTLCATVFLPKTRVHGHVLRNGRDTAVQHVHLRIEDVGHHLKNAGVCGRTASRQDAIGGRVGHVRRNLVEPCVGTIVRELRDRTPCLYYSCRSAVVGSTLAARRAGR
jgi:hypothetical protein